jgi:hypothetical protein
MSTIRGHQECSVASNREQRQSRPLDAHRISSVIQVAFLVFAGFVHSPSLDVSVYLFVESEQLVTAFIVLPGRVFGNAFIAAFPVEAASVTVFDTVVHCLLGTFAGLENIIRLVEAENRRSKSQE